MTTKIIGFHQAEKTKENNYEILRNANSLEFFCPDDQEIDENIIQFLKNNNIDYNCIVNKDWKTFYLFVSLNNFLIQKPYYKKSEKELKTFTLLVNAPRPDRCAIIDKLAEKDLLKDNYYSWLQPEKANFNFKFFDNKKNVLDIEYYTMVNYMQNYPIKCYKNSNWNVVLECLSKYDDGYLTEKTFIPILFKRPFLVFGGPNTNKLIKDFGFDIFEDLIDYSFDYGKLDKRIDLFVKEIGKLSNTYYPKDKLEHNFKVALTIVKNKIASPKKKVSNKLLNYFDLFCKINQVPNKIKDLYGP